MKKIFTLLFFFLIASFTTKVLANDVYVGGYVLNANGTPAVNQAVTISNDSMYQGNTCGVIVHVKYTNTNGFFSDTLICSGTIAAVKVTTPNCNGAFYSTTVPITQANPSVNLTINLTCLPQISCSANYGYNVVNGGSVQFTSTSVASSAITAYKWKFGDGTTSDIANPLHVYANSGTYTACLKITSNGCADSICKAITVTATPPAPACNAEFQFVRDSSNNRLYNFYAGVNTAYPNNDPVVERKWKFGDGDSLVGNIQNPAHLYAVAGTYNVCLRVKTLSGCTSDFCKTITVVNPGVTNCYAAFTYIPQLTLVSFNSSNSYSTSGDSIVLRKWSWGDGTALLQGNVVAPQHQYAQPGTYTVCLTIKTASGCEKTTCIIVTATNINSSCVPQFVWERLSAPRTVAFQSNMSWIPANDSITERKWRFGDGGTILTGNIVNIQHQYPANGIYTACLWMKTANGCTNEVCKLVNIQDSLGQTPPAVNDPVRIISLYPNPVTTSLSTVVWSAYNNVTAELAIYDIYGVRKWYTTKNLLQGNNVTAIPVAGLLTGPYFFKVKTVHGTKSRQFFKL